MAGLGLLTSVLFVPSIYQSDGKYGKADFSFRNLALFNPLPALSVLKHPNILLTVRFYLHAGVCLLIVL